MKKSKKLRTLIKRAKMGKSYAMYELGICYEFGRGLTQNFSEAVFWISLSAKSGYAPAIEWMTDYCFDDDAYIQAEI